MIIYFIIAAAMTCFCIPVGMDLCLRDSGWQAHSLWELQGQAVEGRAGDLSLRIELPLTPPNTPQPSSLFLFFSCMQSYFEGEEHFFQCLLAYNLADAADCVSWIYRPGGVWDRTCLNSYDTQIDTNIFYAEQNESAQYLYSCIFLFFIFFVIIA